MSRRAPHSWSPSPSPPLRDRRPRRGHRPRRSHRHRSVSPGGLHAHARPPLAALARQPPGGPGIRRTPAPPRARAAHRSRGPLGRAPPRLDPGPETRRHLDGAGGRPLGPGRPAGSRRPLAPAGPAPELRDHLPRRGDADPRRTHRLGGAPGRDQHLLARHRRRHGRGLPGHGGQHGRMVCRLLRHRVPAGQRRDAQRVHRRVEGVRPGRPAAVHRRRRALRRHRLLLRRRDGRGPGHAGVRHRRGRPRGPGHLRGRRPQLAGSLLGHPPRRVDRGLRRPDRRGRPGPRGTVDPVAGTRSGHGSPRPMSRAAPGRIRPCTVADVPGVVDLYNRCFAARMTLDRFRWQYLDAPGARPDLSVVYERGGKVRGFVGAVVLPWWIRGRRVVAVRIQDVCVAPEERGRGVFSAMLRAHCALPAPVDLRLAFPNPRSRPAFLRNALFQPHPDIGVLRCDVETIRRAADAIARPCAVTVERPPRFTATDGAFLEARRRDVDAHGARDTRWLHWRLGPGAPHDYLVARARVGDTLVGLVVAKFYAAGRTIDLVECATGDRPDVAATLLDACVDALSHTRPEALETWAGRGYGGTARFRRLGFVDDERSTAMVTRCSPGIGPGPALTWLLSPADSDVY
ncbi:MAG: GNAT family N-acetyltransferase [Deltaproteobacteria bacterium]|nr:MAG: GNAT family N-acetyltransferase [Deltaproteobacteria bacterium]